MSSENNEQDIEPRATTYEIGEKHHGWRLDHFLVERIPKLSRSYIQKLISERVRLSWTAEVFASTKLQAGGKVFCVFPKLDEKQESRRFDVIYEDKDLFAIDKPAGMVVHPTNNTRKNSLIELVRKEHKNRDIQLVHRLDRETSGVLLLAKNREAARWCGQVIMQRNIKKTYLARVRGRVSEKRGTIEMDIGRDMSSKIHVRQKIVEKGESAITHFRVRRVEDHTTLLELEPVTGRRHQLRVHCEWMGHPIVGDPLYGQSDQHYMDYADGKVQRERLHLHAWKLQGTIRGRKLDIEAPIPDLFE